MLLIMGRAIVKTTIFPPRRTLSPSPPIPQSLHKLAVNSVKYPTPTIFNMIVKSELFTPVSPTIICKVEKMSETYFMINKRMIIPPTTLSRIAKSFRIGFMINTEMAVIRPIAIILNIKLIFHPYKLNIVFTVVNKSPISEITITSTITIPASVAKIPMSSFPVCFKIWLTIAVKIPIAAILKMISTPISLLNEYNNQKQSRNYAKFSA